MNIDYIFYNKITIYGSLILALISLIGIFVLKRDLVTYLICLEAIVLSIFLQLVSTSFMFNDNLSKIFFLIVLTIAACESAIGLAVIVYFYQILGSNSNISEKNK